MEAKFIKTVEDKVHDGYYKILIEVEGIRFESISIHKLEELESKGF